MKYIFINNQPDLSNYAFLNGATRIMVDIELNGKKERQSLRDTLISDHKIEDIKGIKKINHNIPVICRINSLHAFTKSEVNNAISSGADFIMLPMFKSLGEVKEVYDFINKRAKLILLFETPQSLLRIHQICSSKYFDEAHIGLNDLSLGMGIDFMFELLTSGIVEYMADCFNFYSVPFGIGGIAKFGEGIASSELVMSEHVRLGSTSVILSRSFHEYSKSLTELTSRINFKHEIDLLNKCEFDLSQEGSEGLLYNKEKLKKQIQDYITKNI
jgi:hypothetical protein